jgi:hypothetical protein
MASFERRHRHRLAALVLGCGLTVGCHGIEHAGGFGSPASPNAPASIAMVASPAQLPAGGGTSMVDVAVIPSSGQAITVTLTTSTGELAESSIVTDASGHARVEWRGNQSSAIAARVGDLTGTVAIQVAAGKPTPAPIPVPDPGPGHDPTPDPTPGPTTPGGTIRVGIDGYPSPAYAGEPMRFSAFIQVLPPVGVARITWDFNGDGTTDATTNEAAWTFDDAGTHTATLVVTTVDGRRGEASIRFTVYPFDALVIDELKAAPSSVMPGEPVTWSASVSAHNGSLPPLEFRWDFDGNGTVDATTAVGTATTAYFTPGRKRMRLTVVAADGRTATASEEVEVNAPK